MKKLHFIFLMLLIMPGINLNAQLPVLVKDINTTASKNSDPKEYLFEHNFNLYFSANDGKTNGLYRTDGTEAGTVKIEDEIVAKHFFVFKDKVHFVAQPKSSTYEAIYKTDGTETGTYAIDYIGRFGYYNPFYIWNDKIFFYATDLNVDLGFELWVSNGESNNAKMLKDIYPGERGSKGTSNAKSMPEIFIEFNNKLFFIANDGTNGEELWTTDGTVEGTQMFKDINPTGHGMNDFNNQMQILNNKLYFIANDGTNGWALWRTDGTVAGTVMFKDFNTTNIQEQIGYLHKVSFGLNQVLIFSANDGKNGNELWVTNGTEAGTYMLKDINPGEGSSSSSMPYKTGLYHMFNFYFIANDGTHGYELWKTNGTAEGTVMVKDINPGTENSWAGSNLVTYHNKIYFAATPNSYNHHIFRTDGTAAGTEMLVPELVTQPNPDPQYLFDAAERTLYFSADYHIPVGRELYKIEIPYQVTTFATPATGGVATGAGSYLVGDKVTLTALPVANFEFINWTNSSGAAVSTTAAYNFTMPNRNVTYTANFRSTINRNLTLTASPAAGGTVKGGGSYPSGTWVTIEASPNSGYEFVNWTEGTSIISTNTEYSFSLEKDRNLTANFKQSTVKYTISLSSSPALGGSTSGEGSYVSGSSVTITATPGKGNEFVNWTERGNEVSQSASYKFTVTRNRSLVANFQATGIKKYTLSLLTIPVEGGTVSGGGTYTTGASVTATATPNKGYQFVNWIENENEVSTEANYTFKLTANRTLSANFISTVGVNNPETVPLIMYPNPAGNTLTIEGITEKTMIRIYNITGGEVMSEMAVGNTIMNISQLNRGLYFVVFETQKSRLTQKLVKD